MMPSHPFQPYNRPVLTPLCLQAQLQRFSGAAAISSDDYYGRQQKRVSLTDDLDVSASELVNRLTFQVRIFNLYNKCVV